MKVLKIEEMLEVQDVDEEIFGDQKTLSDEKSEQESNPSKNKVSEEEESEEEYRKRTGQEP